MLVKIADKAVKELVKIMNLYLTILSNIVCFSCHNSNAKMTKTKVNSINPHYDKERLKKRLMF